MGPASAMPKLARDLRGPRTKGGVFPLLDPSRNSFLEAFLSVFASTFLFWPFDFEACDRDGVNICTIL